MITPRPAPNNSIPKPGFPMIPFFGVEPVLMNDKVSIHLSIYLSLVIHSSTMYLSIYV